MEDIESHGTPEQHPHQLRPIHHRHHNQQNHHHHQQQKQQQQQQQSSDSGYTSQSYCNANAVSPLDKTAASPTSGNQPQWNYRSNQIMRGILPVEFVHTTPSVLQPQQKQDTQQQASPTLSSQQGPSAAASSTPRAKKHSPDVGDEEDEAEEDERSSNFDSSKCRSPKFNKSNNMATNSTVQT